MAIGKKIQNEMPQDLKKQLAHAVRSIKWSYAIFWSPSPRQLGELKWGDGYYNGDIKTRKTVQAAEVDVDQLGLQRTDQLRELYESLTLGETSPQAKRPTAALSPEDLTDAEWYFLVCMSFVFDANKGLPGRAISKNQPIWLCNAHRADTKVFSRSLLAKSASIQTILCFPHFGGVVELGTTELVSEDLNLIQHIKEALDMEATSASVSSMIPNHVPTSITIDTDDGGLDQLLDCPATPVIDVCSPHDSSDDFADNLLIDESNLVEGFDGEEASPMQHWPLMDDAISNCLTSSDCVSQTPGEPEMVILRPDGKDEHSACVRDARESSQQDASAFQGNENHYHSVLSNLLKSSNQLLLGPYLKNGSRQSSFINWRKDGLSGGARVPQSGCHQKLLKKVLFEVACMHESLRAVTTKQKSSGKPDTDETDRNHVLSERKRREKINERFAILGSMVPSGGKVDKVSILDQTIEYLRKLERQVEELESHKEVARVESTTQKKPHHDAIERTSDNYGPNKNDCIKKLLTNKRKACETDRTWPENKKVQLRDSSKDSITVTVTDKEGTAVLIEIRCSWKDSVVIDIMEAVSKLGMDAQTVQSSNADGILIMTVKAKSKGLKRVSPNVVRQALLKVIRKSLS